jgi:hypothetical protein
MAPHSVTFADIERIRAEWAEVLASRSWPQANHIILEKLGHMAEDDPTLFVGPGGDVAQKKFTDAKSLDQNIGKNADSTVLLLEVFAFLYKKYEPPRGGRRSTVRRRKVTRKRRSRHSRFRPDNFLKLY